MKSGGEKLNRMCLELQKDVNNIIDGSVHILSEAEDDSHRLHFDVDSVLDGRVFKTQTVSVLRDKRGKTVQNSIHFHSVPTNYYKAIPKIRESHPVYDSEFYNITGANRSIFKKFLRAAKFLF